MVSEARGAPKHRRRRGLLNWKAVVGIIISVVALYFAFRDMDLRQVAGHIRRANPYLILLATAISTFIFWIRAWRWKAILEPVADVPFRSRFAAVNIGFMGNNLLPARVGEFLRAYSLSRMEPVPLVASFASLVVERLFDGVLVLTLLFISMSLPDFPAFTGTDVIELPGIDFSFTIAGLARGAALVVITGLVVLMALVFFPRPAVAVLERAVKLLPEAFRRPIVDALEAFLTGVGVLRNPRLLLRTTWWSIVLWLVNACGFWAAFHAFGFDLPFTAALFFQSFIALAVSIPSAPGFFGVYHAAAVFVLGKLWGGDLDQAGAFALGFHLAAFIPVTSIGLYYAVKMGISLREAAESEEIVEEAVEDVVDPEKLA